MKNPLHIKSSVQSLRLSPTLEVKFSSGSEAGTIEGYASAFGGNPDSYGEVVQKGAFTRTLKEHRANGTMPAMLWSHNQTQPIGKWTDMYEDDFGLFVKGKLNLETSHGKDAHAHIVHGDATGFSIGFRTAPNGQRKDQNGATLLTDVDLVEVSAVVFPANRRALVTSVKTLQSKSELIDMLRENGLSRAASTRIAAGGWQALAGADHEKAFELADMIDRATQQLRKL
ncbi:HK97 family phage prohead protease [Paenochrobactrum sp. BZR 588]|uniref:HK97 family phage prohead protease n=1 Tax=unclassified Paenochrobactrum TaxID=2639760 RepID=UPI0038529367